MSKRRHRTQEERELLQHHMSMTAKAERNAMKAGLTEQQTGEDGSPLLPSRTGVPIWQ